MPKYSKNEKYWKEYYIWIFWRFGFWQQVLDFIIERGCVNLDLWTKPRNCMEVGWNVCSKGSLPFPAAKATELDGLIDGPEIAAHYHLHYILKQEEEEEAQTSESKVPICESQRQRRVRKSGRLISKWEVESPRRQTLFPVRECHTLSLFCRRLCILLRFKWHKYRCKRMTPLFCSIQAMRSES